jgi:hypothetical protein
MSQEDRYRQLAVFSVILAEVVLTPLILGGLIYFIFRHHQLKTVLGALGAVLGLGLAFYRIGRMMKGKKGDETGRK